MKKKAGGYIRIDDAIAELNSFSFSRLMLMRELENKEDRIEIYFRAVVPDDKNYSPMTGFINWMYEENEQDKYPRIMAGDEDDYTSILDCSIFDWGKDVHELMNHCCHGYFRTGTIDPQFVHTFPVGYSGGVRFKRPSKLKKHLFLSVSDFEKLSKNDVLVSDEDENFRKYGLSSHGMRLLRNTCKIAHAISQIERKIDYDDSGAVGVIQAKGQTLFDTFPDESGVTRYLKIMKDILDEMPEKS